MGPMVVCFTNVVKRVKSKGHALVFRPKIKIIILKENWEKQHSE